jgi:probable phosphoglycerate mutase
LLLLRHGETQWNADHRLQGVQVDQPLSEAGRASAQRAAASLSSELTELGVVFSSPMSRTRETATILAARRAKVAEQAGLEECDYGAWTGLTRDVIDEKYPGMMGDWDAGRLERPPGGESQEEIARRALRGLQAIIEKTRESDLPILVVTHGDVIRALVAFHGGRWPSSPIDELAGWWFEGNGSDVTSVGPAPSIASSTPEQPR